MMMSQMCTLLLLPSILCFAQSYVMTTRCRKPSMKEKNCTVLPEIPCQICHNEDETLFTSCHLFPSETDNALQNVPTESVDVFLYIKPTSYHLAPVVNLSQIVRIASLQKLTILSDIEATSQNQYYTIEMYNGSVSALSSSNLTNLNILIPINNYYYISEIVRNLRNLKYLDMSYTRALGLDNVHVILNGLGQNQLRHLCLRNFQFPGSQYYRSNLSNFFANMTDFQQLIVLDLSLNGITYIPIIFSKITPNLQELDLSENILIGMDTLHMILDVILLPSIETFNISEQQAKELDPTFATDLLYSEVKQRLATCVDQNEVANITSLEGFLYHKMCNMLKCTSVALFHILCEVKRMGPDIIYLYNSTCYAHMELPLGQNLTHLLLSAIHIEQLSMIWSFVEPNVSLCFRNSNRLEYVHISGISGIPGSETSIQSPSFKYYSRLIPITGLTKVKYLSLANNHMNFSWSLLNAWEFKGLTHLDISGNVILQNSSEVELCPQFPKLESISLSTTHQYAPLNLNKCYNLRTLDLSFNQIQQWNVFDDEAIEMTGVNNWNLTYNNINIFSSNITTYLERLGNWKVDLSDNHLLCDCLSDVSIQSINFIKSHSKHFVNYNSYICYKSSNFSESDKVLVMNFDPSVCLNIIWITTAMCTAVLLIFSLVICLTFVYKYRWKIKYQYYKLKATSTTAKTQGVTMVVKYDAFISYSSDDRLFVHNIMRKEMEHNYGFKLCLHYRDFAIGSFITDSITESIICSRCVIVVLSKSSVKSAWVNYELSFAHKHALEAKKQLIVVKLGYIPTSSLSPMISKILDDHVYLEWPEQENDLAYRQFWSKLLDMMYIYDLGEKAGFLWCCTKSYPRPNSYGSHVNDDEISILSDEFFLSDDSNSDSPQSLSGNLQLSGYQEKNLPSHLKPHLRKAAVAKKEVDMACRLRSELIHQKNQGIVPTWPFENKSSQFQSTQLMDFYEEYVDEFESHTRRFSEERIDLTLQYLEDYKDRKVKVYNCELQIIRNEVDASY